MATANLTHAKPALQTTPSSGAAAGLPRLLPAQEPMRGWRRLLLWGILLALLGVAQSLLLVLTVNHEASRMQDDTEAGAAEAAQGVRSELLRNMQALQALAIGSTEADHWRDSASILRRLPSLGHLEVRDDEMAVVAAQDPNPGLTLFSARARSDLHTDIAWTCSNAQRSSAPAFSSSYFVPLGDGRGHEVIDVCVPILNAGKNTGFVVGTIVLSRLLQAAVPIDTSRKFEFSFVEADGTRLARTGPLRGAGVFRAERLVDLPGLPLSLRAESTRGRPHLVPNLATALVMGLSLALFALVFLLASDVRRRAKAESALAEALAFRKAMEDSLSTGLRARDLKGVVTYANPAFCAMVGFTSEELAAARDTQPYWPAESLDVYKARQQQRLSNAPAFIAHEAREGFETVFARKSGERFPVMVYEAPLVDGQGQHTGWMSAVLDLSAQRQMEDLSRQQQERLQATARLATVGEMASLLSHELNQPLSAIASYASGSLNLLAQPDQHTPALLKQALERVAEQAERAGRVIKSVHDVVRRREQLHETLPAASLVEAVLPLVRLQARKSGTRIEWQAPQADGPALGSPMVRCDRTMIEQVLLNLTRNGIQAMEEHAALAQRVLTLRVSGESPRWVLFSVIDAGPGITPDVGAKLFTPFFTTRAEGMGLGLSLCRTVIEQHGGTLEHRPGAEGVGTEFSFTLPAARKRLSMTASGHPEPADSTGDERPSTRPVVDGIIEQPPHSETL